jgi:hypothetical protein
VAAAQSRGVAVRIFVPLVPDVVGIASMTHAGPDLERRQPRRAPGSQVVGFGPGAVLGHHERDGPRGAVGVRHAEVAGVEPATG